MNAIMKKTYISPEALTVSLTMCNIIAQSPNGSIPGGDANASEKYGIDTEGDVKGLNKNIWDTEW